MDVKDLAEKLKNEIVSWRREIHEYPEIGLEETRTGNMVAQELEKLGIKVTRVAKTGVLGILKGEGSGKTVALRADMDALPIAEASEVPYKSRNPGVMHACGHDGHVAMLLGAAKILSQMRDKISGTIKFVFQPAEEIGLGAPGFIGAGVMEGVDAILALHLWPDLPSGKVSLVPGPRMAAADQLKINVKGKTGHGSMPHQGIDAILAAAAITMNLQSVVSREVPPLEPAVITIGKFTGGTSWNITCDEVRLEGTTRCFSHEVRKNLLLAIERVAKDTAASFRAQAEVEFIKISPPIINDPLITKIAANSLHKLYGENVPGELEKVMGGEDFSYFLETIPGAMAFIGAGNKEKKTDYPLHNDKFNIDEDVLPTGAALHAQFALDFLNR
jgi:amidohydrolase